MENLVNRMQGNPKFWNGKKVFITGHTGFKGSWLTIMLLREGAQVSGYSVDIPTSPSLFEAASLEEKVSHHIGSICDYVTLSAAMEKEQPEIVLHLAAQPLVRLSYSKPVETFQTNVMGTVHVLEVIKQLDTVKSAVMITTDKCYENKEWEFGYREIDPMGGYDPYSSSKGAAELAISSYRRSFFNSDTTYIASARAGNVIGGGDWADDRLIPDLIRGASSGNKVKVRNPLAIRPWQHVLEPLSGYMLLAELGYNRNPIMADAWNFGPELDDAKNVEWIADFVSNLWENGKLWELDDDNQPHEANYLKLDISKAHQKLNWLPKWDVDSAIKHTVDWYKKFYKRSESDSVYNLCIKDIEDFLKS